MVIKQRYFCVRIKCHWCERFTCGKESPTNHFNRWRDVNRCQTAPIKCRVIEPRYFSVRIKCYWCKRFTSIKAVFTNHFSGWRDTNRCQTIPIKCMAIESRYFCVRIKCHRCKRFVFAKAEFTNHFIGRRNLEAIRAANATRKLITNPHSSMDNGDSSTKHCRTFEWILTRISRELHSREVMSGDFVNPQVRLSYQITLYDFDTIVPQFHCLNFSQWRFRSDMWKSLF
jgi:hypothetical protein